MAQCAKFRIQIPNRFQNMAKLILCKQNVHTFPVWYYKLVGKTAKSAKRCNFFVFLMLGTSYFQRL